MIGKKDFGLHFGAMSEPLSKQIKNQGFKFDKGEVTHFEKDAEALVRLRVRGYLNKSAIDSATKNLFNKIKSHIEQLNKHQ